MTTRRIPWTPTETTYDIASEVLRNRSNEIAEGRPSHDRSEQIAAFLRLSHDVQPITPSSVEAIRPLADTVARYRKAAA